MNIREAIALKRAEAKKTMSQKPPPGDKWNGLEDASPAGFGKEVVDDGSDIGRWSLRDTIERARSSGTFHVKLSIDIVC